MTPKAKSAREAAIRIITDLRQQGHTAYLAGGCVRDALLGQAPKDYDVATDATPQAVQRIFPQSAAVGAAFGVVIVYTPAAEDTPRWVTEVATFRAESGYTDGRRPDQVRFTNAEEDAKRRDFTINGLFAEPAPNGNPDQDQIIDFVNGRADLEAKTLRAIGDPGERFGEDYLRMLRAVRFAARLGFTIEPKTSAAIRTHARYLGQISRERIGQEVMAMLCGPQPGLALHLLQAHKLDGPTLNEDPADPALTITDRLDALAKPPSRLAAWMIDRLGEDQPTQRSIDRWRKALSLSNDHRDELGRLIELLEYLKDWGTLGIAARKRLAAHPSWLQALLLRDAIEHDADGMRHAVEHLASDGIGLNPTPLLTGEDLIDQGLTPGPRFKTLLDSAYDRQLEGEWTNREQAIAWLDQLVRRP